MILPVKIPIENIYYLLCYAWDKLAEKDVVAVQALDSMSLVELFSRVLLNGTNHLLKRGFDRGYVLHHEWTQRIRGKICFPEAIQKNGMRSVSLPCEYGDLSYDVLHNRILKATMLSLSHAADSKSGYAEKLLQQYKLLSEVQDITLNNRIFGQVQLHRNNQFYDFLLKVCELIFKNLLISEKTGTSKFMDFQQDPRQMAYLYENFVRNFLNVHTDFDVRREDIYWQWNSEDQTSASLLPKMQTDISLTSPTRKLIIDCKFTPEATRENYAAQKLRSEHLYQIHAYLTNLPQENLPNRREIMLLYPTVDSTISATYKDQKGWNIYIRTINLNQPWQQIHNDLMALVA